MEGRMREKKKGFWAAVLVCLVAVVNLVIFLFTLGRRGGKKTEEDAEKPEDKEKKESVQISLPEVSDDIPLGPDFFVLDYADKSIIILHAPIGLFVYSRKERRLIGSVELASIGCNYIQGDNCCEVRTREDGAVVYLHAQGSDVCYEYEVYNKKLFRRPFASGEDLDGIRPLLETDMYVKPDAAGWYSPYCVVVSTDKGTQYGYLSCTGGLWQDISYMEGDDCCRIFENGYAAE